MNRLLPGAIIVLLMMAGCTSTPVYQLTKTEQSKYANVPSETLVNDLQAKLVQAHTDKIDFYAPASFAQAKSAADAVSKFPLDKSHRQKILEYVAMGEQAISSGYAAKTKAVKVLADVLALNTHLKAMGAPDLHPQRYAGLVQGLRQLLATLEKGDDATADKQHSILLGQMNALKVDVAKEKALGQVKQLISQLETDKAADVAPQSVQAAEDSLAKANAYIQMHPDDQDGIAKVAGAALNAAHHAMWVAARVKQLSALPKPPFETLILNEEQRLASVGMPLGTGDVQGSPLDQQTAAIVARVNAVNEKLTATGAKLATTQAKVKSLESQFNGCQASAGTAGTESAQLQSENTLLQQKVALLETNIGVLKDQLKLLQNILYSKTSETVHAPTAVKQPVKTSQPVSPRQPAKENAQPPSVPQASTPTKSGTATKSNKAPVSTTTPASSQAASVTAPEPKTESKATTQAALPKSNNTPASTTTPAPSQASSVTAQEPQAKSKSATQATTAPSPGI